jgi:hypothetical protein
MSETEADREFFASAEAAFIRRRGTPFLLSPKDFALLKEWRSLKIPIEAIEQGIEDSFGRREERGTTGRINSLAYCRDAVLAAWERRAETAVGRGSGREATEPEVAPALVALQEKLRAIEEQRPELSAAVESARRSLSRLTSSRSSKSVGEVETSLARIDKRLAGALLDMLPEAERKKIGEEAAVLLAAARGRMDDLAALRTLHALERRMLRERLDLPRLTLLP